MKMYTREWRQKGDVKILVMKKLRYILPTEDTFENS